MTKQLQTQSKVIPNEQCNFVLLDIPEEVRCILSLDIIVETNHKLIEFSIGHNISLSYEGIMKYIGGEENIIRCESGIDSTGARNTHGRMFNVRCITYDQFLTIWEKATHANCLKKKPIIAEFMATKVLPLFTKEVSTQLKSPELDILPATETSVTTMSSLEIAELTGKAHKNVIRDIDKIISVLGNELKIEPVKYRDKKGEMRDCYNLDRESALLLTSGYDVHLRLKIIRRLDELESGIAQPKPAIPQSLPDALRLAATLAEEKEQLQIERDEAVKARQWINDKKVASAMGTAGALANKLKKLEAKINSKASAIKYATVLAIQSRVKDLKASGLKLGNYCRKYGLEIQDIPDPRFGIVHSYPADAWKNVYSVDINQVLGA